MPELEIHYPDGLVGYRALTRGVAMTIGSGPQNDLRLNDREVGEKHCSVYWDGNNVQLDASLGAVHVNGSRAKSSRLAADDELTIGGFQLFLRAKPGESLGGGGKGAETDRGAAKAMPVARAIPARSAARPTARASAAHGEYYVPIWRSPLFLIMSGSLLLLGLIGVAVYIYYVQGQQQRAFNLAKESLDANLPQKAVAEFNAFLKEFPEGDLANQAVVWRDIAKLRAQKDAQSPNWKETLDAAQNLVRDNADLPLFQSSEADVVGLLSDTAKKMATAAKDRKDNEPLNLAREVLRIFEHRAFKEKKPTEAIDEINKLLTEAMQEIDKNEIYKAALARMDSALKDGNPIVVYMEHQKLFRRFPDFKTNATIQARREKARDMETKSITFEPLDTGRAAPPVPPAPGRTWIGRRAAPNAKRRNVAVPIVVADALYGLDVGSGEPLWRVATGFEPAFAPLVIDQPRRFLVHFPIDNTVALLESETGKVVWRQPLGVTRLRWPSQPIHDRGGIYLLAYDPRDPLRDIVVVLQPISGRPQGKYILPQPLARLPAFDQERGRLLLLGEQESLYTIYPAEQKAENTTAIGHEPGSIQSWPLLRGRFLFLVENLPNDKAAIRCYVINKEGLPQLRQEETVDGWVYGSGWSPVQVGGRLFVTTSQDRYYVYDLGGELDPTPMKLATRSAPSATPVKDTPFPLAAGEQDFWTIGRNARQYRLALNQTTAPPAWELPLDGIPLPTPHLFGDLVVIPMKVGEAPGVVVSALDGGNRAELWRVELGRVPEAVQMDPDKPNTLLLVGRGGETRLSVADLQSDRVEMWALDQQTGAGSVTARTQVALVPFPAWRDGALSWGGRNSDRMAFFSPGLPKRDIFLRAPLATEPCLFGKGLLLAGTDGFLYWYDPRQGKEIADPFASPFADGKPLNFKAVGALDDQYAVVAAGSLLLKLQFVKDPVPHFEEIGRRDLQEQSLQLAVAAGKLVLARKQDLVAIDPGDLKDRRAWNIGATISRPPLVLGDRAFFLTDQNELLCTGPSAGDVDILWRTRFDAPPLGPPMPRGETLWMTFASGRVTELRVSDGKVSNEWQTGRAALQGPWLLEDRLVLLAPDGSVVSVPARQ